MLVETMLSRKRPHVRSIVADAEDIQHRRGLG
jgi:hypothetical protein